MKFIKYQALPEAPSNRALSLTSDQTWIRFGDETLFYSNEEQDGGAIERGANFEKRELDTSKEQLHIVVQNGRLFQQHHPDVPVIHDRGRFLLVKLDREKAREMEREMETCFGIIPLADQQVVFDIHQPTSARAPVAFVQTLVNEVKRESFETNLRKLVSFSTRHSTSAEYINAAVWARNLLAGMNYQVRSQTVTVGNHGNSRNIIADKQGAGNSPRSVVVITAHLDSINLTGGPMAPAPGADDNGSGSAGLLEIARVFQNHRGAHDLRLILFGGEEQDLFGSKRYVNSLSNTERRRIKAVVNMDMIGSLNSTIRSVLIEGASISQTVIDNLSQAASTYTNLRVETSLNPFASDHVPFINAGIPAVLTIEGADNANHNIHSANDIIDAINYDFALEILRMNVAYIANEIGFVQ